VIPAPGEGRLLGGMPLPGVAVAELFADPPGVDLFPEEAEIVRRAVVKRRREFATVRLCARTALARLGRTPGPILPAGDGPLWADRAPRWPDGIVGSMTHCDGYRAAAVAREEEVASLGVDAESNAPLPEGVQDTVLLPEERDTVTRLGAFSGVAWDRLLFSAKESVFKAWFPLTGRWLDFLECAISPDPHRGTFSAMLRIPGPTVAGERIDQFSGRWRVRRTGGKELVATAVVVPALAPSRSWPDRITSQSGA
jgi:4'-phosphopantetheinyl transferase EntD